MIMEWPEASSGANPLQPAVGVGMPELTVVFPCLNEEVTLPGCLSELRLAFTDWESGSYEILVVDNGSTDSSAALALEGGAQVLMEPVRGYGQAIRRGIHAARSEWVIFADADGTYPYDLAPALYRQTVSAQADLGLASRLRGAVAPGAMPFLHQWVGTPFFTKLLNVLFKGGISDCGTGFRCVRRAWFLNQAHHAPGMEFASENLIRALKSKARIIEIEGGLRAGPPQRQPHLRTWRDGMRHLMFILAECPPLFEKTGLAICAGASLLQAAGASTLIHGHTHRPADHALGHQLRRIVLSDWDLRAEPARAQVLRIDATAQVQRLGVHRLATPAA